MIVFLRFVGIVNAAVWFGASVFYITGVDPAFGSAEMRWMLGNHAGAAAYVVMERFYMLHHVCGIIALAHLTAEWLYMNRPLERLMLWLVAGVFALGLAGGFLLQPRLESLYAAHAWPAEGTEHLAPQAARSLRVWNTVGSTIHVVMTLALLLYLWRIIHPSNTARFNRTPKLSGNIFRG